VKPTCSTLLHTTDLPQTDVLRTAFSEVLELPKAQAALSDAMPAPASSTLPPCIATAPYDVHEKLLSQMKKP
jgi:hypothetical protein